MRGPMGFALMYPERLANDYKPLDFFEYANNLTFERPDRNVFDCINMAYDVLETGGSSPVALNAANEVLVAAFLDRKIKFTDIQDNIKRILDSHNCKYNLSLEDILETDRETREKTRLLF